MRYRNQGTAQETGIDLPFIATLREEHEGELLQWFHLSGFRGLLTIHSFTWCYFQPDHRPLFLIDAVWNGKKVLLDQYCNDPSLIIQLRRLSPRASHPKAVYGALLKYIRNQHTVGILRGLTIDPEDSHLIFF